MAKVSGLKGVFVFCVAVFGLLLCCDFSCQIDHWSVGLISGLWFLIYPSHPWFWQQTWGGWGEKRHLSKMTTCEWLTASKNCNQSWCKWPILCELRLSVDARIRTCKAGLVQVLIGLVKHIRCSDFEMSLTPIIPWHYSQAHGPRWAACLSTPHWRRKTTSAYEHLTATFHRVYILKERESDTELDFELWTFIHLSWMLWELFCHWRPCSSVPV